MLIPLIAQQTQQDITKLMLLGGVVIAAVLLLLVVIMVLRKKLFPKEEEDVVPAGFGLSQLKDLYDQGLLSDDEYNAAKAKIVAESRVAFMALGEKKKKQK